MTTDIRALLAAAMAHHGTQRLAEAEQLYIEILRQDPRQSDALHLLGVIAHQRGDHTAAVARIMAAIQSNPRVAAYHANLAVAYRATGDAANAILHYDRALDLKPGDVEIHVQAAALRGEQGDLPGAAALLRRAITLDRGHVRAHCLLAHALQCMGRSPEAAATYEQALALDPALPEALNNLGLIYREQGDLEAAADRLGRAVSLAPGYADALYNRGLALEGLGRLEEALESYARAAALAPDRPDAAWNEGLLRLLFGDYERGWKGYEARTRRGTTADVTGPRWTGEPAPGKSLLLHTEQGFGDAIQFIRYAALARPRVGRIVVQCHPKLVRLFRSAPGVDEAVPYGAPVSCDMQLPLMSLPLLYNTTLDTIPARTPYLWPDTGDVAQWRARLGAGLKIGLVWRGDPANTIHAKKSLGVGLIAEILPAADATWVILQIDAKPEERAALQEQGRIADPGGALSDWADTAALVSTLDLVIAIDTGVAHLAGALATPCWIMLSAISDWRWLRARGDSPWYPTATLIRQTTPGDWTPVIQDVQRRLHAMEAPTG